MGITNVGEMTNGDVTFDEFVTANNGGGRKDVVGEGEGEGTRDGVGDGEGEGPGACERN